MTSSKAISKRANNRRKCVDAQDERYYIALNTKWGTGEPSSRGFPPRSENHLFSDSVISHEIAAHAIGGVGCVGSVGVSPRLYVCGVVVSVNVS